MTEVTINNAKAPARKSSGTVGDGDTDAVGLSEDHEEGEELTELGD